MAKYLLVLAISAGVSLSLGCRKAPTSAAQAATAAAQPATAAQQPAAAAQPQPGGAAQPVAASSPGQPPVPGAPAVKPVPAQLPDVLARVNGEPIGRWELETTVKQLEARAGGPVPPERRDEVLRGVIDQLVAYHLLAQESRARKLVVADADVEARMSEMRKNFPTQEAFEQRIAADGLTVDHLRQQTRLGLEINKIVDAEITPNVTVSDADVSGFYNQNLDKFKQDETVHASHILISVPMNATPEQKAAAKTKAQGILKQVRGGGDFAAIAKAQSQDPGSAPKGGDLGFFGKGQMVPAFEAAAFSLKPGTVSDLVETPFGFHIIKVQERRPAHTAPLTEVAPQIKDYLLNSQREAKLEQFVEQAKSKSKIEILV